MTTDALARIHQDERKCICTHRFFLHVTDACSAPGCACKMTQLAPVVTGDMCEVRLEDLEDLEDLMWSDEHLGGICYACQNTTRSHHFDCWLNNAIMLAQDAAGGADGGTD